MKRREFMTSIGALALAGDVAENSPKAPFSDAKIDTDRWIELDLYWFDRNDIAKSVSTFLARVYPVYQNATGWRGVILNVG